MITSLVSSNSSCAKKIETVMVNNFLACHIHVTQLYFYIYVSVISDILVYNFILGLGLWRLTPLSTIFDISKMIKTIRSL